jgi:hypothetical protein
VGHVLELKGDKGGRLVVDVLGREFPDIQDYWDGNWLICRVTISIGGFRGTFDSYFRTDELSRLRDGVRSSIDRLDGSFLFDSMENQLKVVGTGDGRGHFEIKCTAQDVAGIGNQLTFELETDQTLLSAFGSQLDEALAAYPVVGTP